MGNCKSVFIESGEFQPPVLSGPGAKSGRPFRRFSKGETDSLRPGSGAENLDAK